MTFQIFTPQDIEGLIEDAVAESTTIEFKQELPRTDYEGRKEYLADVTSFANASGGQILFGIREDNGIAIEAIGLENRELDREILRLENMARDCIKPRIAGLNIGAIEINEDRSILVVSIPKSFLSPHVVEIQNHWRFYGRNSAGKYQLDVTELRTAFDTTQNLTRRVAEFRAERLYRIKANELAAPLQDGGKLVLHIIPMNAISNPQALDMNSLVEDPDLQYNNLAPLSGGVAGARFNLDGALTYNDAREAGRAASYTLLFRSGIIEAADASLFGKRDDQGRPFIPSVVYERHLRTAYSHYMSLLNRLEIASPLVLMISFLNIENYYLQVAQNLMLRRESCFADRTDFIIPETLVNTYQEDLDNVLRPHFNTIWNAFGFERDFNYDTDGNWLRD